MTIQTATIATVETVVADIMAKAAGGRKLAASVRSMATTIATIEAAADTAGALRREALAKVENYLKAQGKALAEADKARYKKSVVNALAYAVAELAACYGKGASIKWSKAKLCYIGTDTAADDTAADNAETTVAGAVPATSESEAQAESKAAAHSSLKVAILAALQVANAEAVLAEVAAIVAEVEKAAAAEQALLDKAAAEQAAAELAADKAAAAQLADQLAAIQAKLAAADKAAQLVELGAKPATAAQLIELVTKKA